MRAAAPLAVARRSGQQQYDQHHDRSDENRYDESAQKTQTTLAAAQPGEKAEYEIYNDAYRYGHYAIALLILLLSETVRGRTIAVWHHALGPLVLVLVAVVDGAVGATVLDRMPSFSLCALMNSR